jgi:hypothetical protein
MSSGPAAAAPPRVIGLLAVNASGGEPAADTWRASAVRSSTWAPPGTSSRAGELGLPPSLKIAEPPSGGPHRGQRRKTCCSPSSPVITSPAPTSRGRAAAPAIRGPRDPARAARVSPSRVTRPLHQRCCGCRGRGDGATTSVTAHASAIRGPDFIGRHTIGVAAGSPPWAGRPRRRSAAQAGAGYGFCRAAAFRPGTAGRSGAGWCLPSAGGPWVSCPSCHWSPRGGPAAADRCARRGLVRLLGSPRRLGS